MCKGGQLTRQWNSCDQVTPYVRSPPPSCGALGSPGGKSYFPGSSINNNPLPPGRREFQAESDSGDDGWSSRGSFGSMNIICVGTAAGTVVS